jgi:hypothetical protein
MEVLTAWIASILITILHSQRGSLPFKFQAQSFDDEHTMSDCVGSA